MSIITTYSVAVLPSALRNVFIAQAKVRRALNDWVAAYLALCERRATAWTLKTLNEREFTYFRACHHKSLAQVGERRKQETTSPRAPLQRQQNWRTPSA